MAINFNLYTSFREASC